VQADHERENNMEAEQDKGPPPGTERK